MTNKQNLTDRKLVELYFGIQSHYNTLLTAESSLKTGEQKEKIYRQMVQAVNFALHSPHGHLKNLDLLEQEKAYKILDFFFQAVVTPQDDPKGQVESSVKIINRIRQEEALALKNSSYVIFHETYVYPGVFYHPPRTWLWDKHFVHGLNGPHTHGHSRPGDLISKEDTRKVADVLILLVIILLAVVLATIAVWYMLAQAADSFERFQYNEGWLKAAISMLSITLSGLASTMLAALFVAEPLAMLAISAGCNPMGIVILGLICCGVIGAALGCFFTNQIMSLVTEKTNPEALDPQDPHRFEITEAEALNLQEQDIDPIHVKCAIAQLRAQMGEKRVPAPFTPSFWFFKERTTLQQDNLDLIRKLRRGELKNLTITEGLPAEYKLCFDFKATENSNLMHQP